MQLRRRFKSSAITLVERLNEEAKRLRGEASNYLPVPNATISGAKLAKSK